MTVKQNYVSSILSLESKDKEEKQSTNGSTDLVKGESESEGTTRTTTRLRGGSNETSPYRKCQRPQRMKGAPDGGFGWWVVFASFIIHVIADGVTYTFGIFYFELIHYFASGKGLTAWVPSIMTGMTFAVGPIASGLTNKFGCRAINAAGAVLAAFGLAISIYAPSVVMLLFTIGVCTGAGFGLIYLPAIVCVTCYFDRKRAFATGIAVCGSGIGAAIFAPFTDFLIKALGWKGAMVVIAALVLTCSIFGLLFKPLEIEYEDDEEAGMLYEEEGQEELSDAQTGMMMRTDHPNRMMREWISEEEDSLISLSNKRRLSDHEKESEVGLSQSIAEEEEDSGEGKNNVEDPVSVEMLPSSLPQPSTMAAATASAIPPGHGLRTRRKMMMPSIRSDVNLKIMMPSEPDGNVMHADNPASSSVMQSAPVRDSPSRHFTNAFKLHSLFRGSFNDSTNTVIANTPQTAASNAPSMRLAPAGSSSRPAVNRSTSKISSHASQSISSSRKKLGSQVIVGPLARADIFYSRSTLNLPQSQSKSNVMLYTASSATVSDVFRRAQQQAQARREEADQDNDVSDAMDEEGGGKLRTKRINFSRQVTVEQAVPDTQQETIVEEDENEVEEYEAAAAGVSNGCCPEEMVQMFKLMMDFKILSNPVFLMFSISNFITCLGYYVPHIYLKDKAMDALGQENITHGDASNLIAMVGIGSTIGRLLFGYLSDFPTVNRLTLYNVCLTFCGIAVICTSFTTTYTGLATYSTIFGLFCGAYVSLMSVILVDLLGLEKLTNAFGILMVFQGVACLIGPPVIGWLYDVTGSYEPGFNLAGALISLSGLMLFVVPYMETKPYIEMMRIEAMKSSMMKTQISDLQSDAACTDTVTTMIAVPTAGDHS